MTDEEYLGHIERAAIEILAHTSGLALADYEADTKTQRAVERNLQIIGEAAHKLSRAFRLAHDDIPWEDIYAARNVVVHHYFGVNQKIVWDIVQEDLPPLLNKVQSVLGRTPRE